MDQPGPMPVEELIKALQRVLLAEPGAKVHRRPDGHLGIVNAAGKYAGLLPLPATPQDAPPTRDWNDLPADLQAQLLEGIAQADRGETVDLGDFSQYLTDDEVALVDQLNREVAADQDGV